MLHQGNGKLCDKINTSSRIKDIYCIYFEIYMTASAAYLITNTSFYYDRRQPLYTHRYTDTKAVHHRTTRGNTTDAAAGLAKRLKKLKRPSHTLG